MQSLIIALTCICLLAISLPLQAKSGWHCCRKILAGGCFTSIAGEDRSFIARLSADEAALQNLRVSSDGTTLSWMRGQSSPKVYKVTFAYSQDGTNWTGLGTGTRIANGWQLSGQSLAYNEIGHIRAQGQSLGGFQNGSTGLIESVKQYYNYKYFTPTPTSMATTGILLLNREIKAYNNQINPEKGEYTTIRWSQPSDAKTTIRIYNLLGKLVKTLVNEIHYVQGQTHEIRWSGINGAGNIVGSGIYIAHIKAGNWQDYVKIAVVK